MAADNRYFYIKDKPLHDIKDSIGWEGLGDSDGVLMVICDHITAMEKKIVELEARIDLMKSAQAGPKGGVMHQEAIDTPVKCPKPRPMIDPATGLPSLDFAGAVRAPMPVDEYERLAWRMLDLAQNYRVDRGVKTELERRSA